MSRAVIHSLTQREREREREKNSTGRTKKSITMETASYSSWGAAANQKLRL